MMETCSYLYSLENHFSHVSTYILQLWPDTSSMYPAMPDTCFLYISFSFCRIHALRILLCRIPLFHSSSTQYSAYPALTETFPSYLSLPAVACVILHILLLSVMAGYMPLYLPCRIPLFHTCSRQHSTFPALMETFLLYLSLPAVA